MYLFFDTETTGLPLDWKAPITDLKNWPRLVQIAWSRYDSSGNKISEKDYIVKPDGFTIPKFSTAVHKITTEKAIKEGVNLEKSLREFAQDIRNVKFLVAHNMEFDSKVVGAEFLRKEIENNLSDLPKIDTMKESVDFCKIESPRGYKWPTLSELYRKLFGEDFDNAHNAYFDISACAKCFFELKKLNVFDNEKIAEKEEEYIQERNIKLI